MMISKTSVLKQMTALLAGCMLFSANAAAFVLFQNSPSTSALVGIQTDNSTGPLPLTETFSLGGPATITSFTWWGYDLGGLGGANNFFVSGPLIGVSGLLSVGSTQVVEGADMIEYTLDFSANPVSFAGGATFVSLINDSFDVEWYWQGTSTVDGSRAFRIEGTRQNVPEPGTLALLGLALLGLGLTRVRKLF